MITIVIDILVAIIKAFEGFSPRPYRCPAGVLTIGYGETLGVTEDMVWTQVEAESRLRGRLLTYVMATLMACPQLWLESPWRIAACVSLAYNIGNGAFSASSVCRRTKRREYPAAADSFLLWNKIRGAISRGLTRRRSTERATYLRTA